MAVRLNKALKELNVGINTVAEFLQKKGMALEDASPNAKITDEQYEELKTAFGKDKDIHAETKLDIQKRKEKERKEKEERKEQERKEQEQKKQEIFRVKAENKVQFKVVGTIADNAPKKEEKPAPKQEEPKAEPVAKKPEPVAETIVAKETKKKVEKVIIEEQPVAAATVQEQKAEPKNTEEVFRASTPDAGVQFKQVGFIDLSSLNSKTRPDKKSKAERKKEREEKDRQRQEMKNKAVSANGTATGQGDVKKKKRQRIGKERVDVNAAANQAQQKPNQQGGGKNGQQKNGKNQPKGQGFEGGKKNKKFTPQPKQELSDEEVAKQVKETLARLTSKQTKKGVKDRKDKRDAIHNRMQELENEENAESKVLKITEFVTANELASMMDVSVTQVIGTCMSIGMMVSINQRLDAETINIVAEEFGFTTSYVSEEVSNAIVEEEDAEEDLEERAPIITVMGHVDHGKTSLLDYIRKANVIAGEAGGITQHIGAYNVKLEDGRHITFLDTPGHEAFTAMRARGAQVTDIAILVVAADDGVMPQTIEAIDHAKAAGVPIIVAINKIDKPEADPDRIKQELTNYGLISEEWGGDTIMVPVSAKKGMGIEELLEMILLVAEVAELKANPNRNAKGKVIESKLDKGRGAVATLLVQAGTLHVGDFLIVGTTQGRIRAMFDYKGQAVKVAGPSTPVEILGLNEVPEAGDDYIAVDNEKLAKQVADKRQKEKHLQEISRNTKVSLEDLFAQIKEGDIKELNIILKADVQGSIEAIRQSLEKLGNDEVRVNIIRTAVGGIREADVMLAAASNALIIGFNVRPDVGARKMAEKESIQINTYRVIYEAIEDVKAALSGMLDPDIKEVELGQAEVRSTFKVPKVGLVAGCYVTEGKITRNARVRVVRDGVVIHDGNLGSLKRFKDDVKEVATGYECGLGFERFNDIKEGDILEAYTFEEVKRAL